MCKKIPVFDNSYEPIVGKTYMVQCAKLTSFDGIETIYVPIIPILHSDKAFGISHKHYHIDGRFLSVNDGKDFNLTKKGETYSVIAIEDVGAYYVFKSTELQKKKCLRSNTGIYLPNDKYKKTKPFRNWYSQQIGKDVHENKCPHYGALMLDKGDTLVCPLHGLMACKKTNKIIERTW